MKRLSLIGCCALISCVPPIDAPLEAGEMVGASENSVAGEELVATTSGMTAGTINRTTCNLGESVGLCEICGPNNGRLPAMNDPNCPEIDCSALNSYRVVSDEQGRLECRLQEFIAGEANCQGPQTCINDPRLYCESQVEEIFLSREEIGECQTLEGCNDETPPELIPRPGEVCRGGLGECNEAGECELMRSCLTLFNYNYNANNQLCGDQLATQNSCDFYVSADQNPYGSAQISCDQFCSANGGGCLQAWEDANDNCDRGGGSNCSNTFQDSICRCSAPMP